MKRLNWVILVLIMLCMFALYARIIDLNNYAKELEVELAQIKGEREDLRAKLTKVELEYDSLSVEYYGEIADRVLADAEIEELLEEEEEVEELNYELLRSIDEVDLLARCCSAEAGNMNYESQKGIAQVILNRVESDKFPDSIEGVIYQEGQFEVVPLGAINKRASSETVRNVIDVILYGYELPSDVLYFHSEKAGSKNAYTCIEGTAFFKK